MLHPPLPWHLAAPGPAPGHGTPGHLPACRTSTGPWERHWSASRPGTARAHKAHHGSNDEAPKSVPIHQLHTYARERQGLGNAQNTSHTPPPTKSTVIDGRRARSSMHTTPQSNVRDSPQHHTQSRSPGRGAEYCTRHTQGELLNCTAGPKRTRVQETTGALARQ